MKGLKKKFITRLEKVWAKEFPCLQRTPNTDVNSCLYCCDKYFHIRKLLYFFRIAFSSRINGRFTLYIEISNSFARKGKYQFGVLNYKKVGYFPISKVLKSKDFYWHLEDIEGRQTALFASCGISGLSDLVKYNNKNRWRPSSYELPIEVIIDEAINDLNKRLKKSVFPKLKIECDKVR